MPHEQLMSAMLRANFMLDESPSRAAQSGDAHLVAMVAQQGSN